LVADISVSPVYAAWRGAAGVTLGLP